MRRLWWSVALALLCLTLVEPLVRRHSAHAGGVSIETKIQFASPGGIPLYLDAYVPEGRGLFTGVILIHGGAWVAGGRGSNNREAMYMAEHGLATFAVDYRLAPDYTYPAALQDVQAAVRWVRAHAARFHVDPRKLGAAGGSAGGHLAVLLATVGEGSLDKGSRVRVAVSWSGPMELLTVQEGFVVGKFLGCDLHTPDCHEKAKEASPITHVDPTDPPVLLANATDEVIPVSQAQEMAATLQANGIPTQLIEVGGSAHSGQYLDEMIRVGTKDETVLQASVDFLLKWSRAKPRGAASPTPTAVSPSPPSQSAKAIGSPQASPGGPAGAVLAGGVASLIVVVAVVVLFVWLRRAHRTPRQTVD